MRAVRRSLIAEIPARDQVFAARPSGVLAVPRGQGLNAADMKRAVGLLGSDCRFNVARGGLRVVTKPAPERGLANSVSLGVAKFVKSNAHRFLRWGRTLGGAEGTDEPRRFGPPRGKAQYGASIRGCVAAAMRSSS